MSVLYSFVWLNNIPLYDCSMIYSSADDHLGCFHFLALLSNAAVTICIQVSFCGHMFSFLLDSRVGTLGKKKRVGTLGAEFLGHVVILCLTFCQTT